MQKKRLQELAGIGDVATQTSDPIVPSAYAQYGHVNQDIKKIDYIVKISSPSKSIINQVWTQIRLYQLGTIETMDTDENREVFDLTFKPTVEKARILDVLTSLFGDRIEAEILEGKED